MKEKFQSTKKINELVKEDEHKIDLTELIPFLSEPEFLKDSIYRDFYVRELVKLLPECYSETSHNVTFYKMEDKRTMNLDSEPFKYHDRIPFDCAKEMLKTLNEIKYDEDSDIEVSSLINMIYIRHNGELYATQFKDVNGIYMTSEGFVLVP